MKSSSTESVERAAYHRRLLVLLWLLSFVLQLLTSVFLWQQQMVIGTRMEAELRLLQTYNQNARERLIALEERTK